MKSRFAALIFGLCGLSTQVSVAAESAHVACPMVYQPAVCTYGEYAAEGSNKCFARISLQNLLKRSGVDYEPEKIQCHVADALLRSESEYAE